MVAEVTSSTGVQHFELKTKEGWIVFLDARSKAYNEETRREVALIQVTVTCPGDPAGPELSQSTACLGDPSGPVDACPSSTHNPPALRLTKTQKRNQRHKRTRQKWSGRTPHCSMVRPALPHRPVYVFLFCRSASLIAFSRRWLADLNCPTSQEETKTKEVREDATKKEEKTTNREKKGTRRVRDGEDERKSFEVNKFRNSKEVFDKRSTSSAQRSSQPQVTPSLDRPPFRKKSTVECLTMQEKNGFLFSKEQLNYSQTCQLSSFQKQHQQ